jgi:hypothetical protein
VSETARPPEIAPAPAEGEPDRRLPWPAVLAIVLASVLLTGLVTAWAVKTYLFPEAFTPVILSPAEQRELDAKLERLGGPVSRRAASSPGPTLEPEPYSEVGATREIRLSERELNALIAHNTDLSSRLAIDLSHDLASAKLLITLDETAPILGGETVKVTAGLELRYAAGRPVVALKGVSIWGVPIPNAWLGGLKNVDLVAEFGEDRGFWQGFADGVEDLRIEEGALNITLKE